MQPEDTLANIRSNQLHEFLRICALGNLQTDASMLSTQQEQYLFRLLEKLHQQHVDVKGIWPLMSLCFKNRSGLVLLTSFNNTKVNYKEFLVRKNFLRQIQVLQNQKITLNNIRKLLKILDLEQSIFIQKFTQQIKIIRKAKKQITVTASKKDILLSDMKIYGKQEYDSEPQYQPYFIEDQQVFNHTVNYQARLFIQERSQNQYQIKKQQHHSHNQQQQRQSSTLTIPVKKQIQPPTTARKKIKKPRRPNQRTKKAKLRQQKKIQQKNLIDFVSSLRQKTKLKKIYSLLPRQSDDIVSTPQKVNKKIVNRGNRLSRRKNMVAEQRNQRQRYHEMDIQNNNPQSSESENDSFIIDDEQENSEIQRLIRFQRKQQKNKKQKQRRLIPQRLTYSQQNSDKQNNSFIEQESQSLQQIVNYNKKRVIDSQSQLQNPVRNQLIISYNQDIKNMKIKRIIFPLNLQTSILAQQRNKTFDIKKFQNYIQAMDSQKQKFKQVKKMVENKDSTDFYCIMRVLKMRQFEVMQKYVNGYIKPILIHKFVSIYANILKEVLNNLYTSSQSTLLQSCQPIILLHNQLLGQSPQSNQKLKTLLIQSLTTILQSLQQKQKINQTMLQLASPLKIIKQRIRIKLQQQYLQQSIIIGLCIIKHGFIDRLFYNNNNNNIQQNYKIFQKSINEKISKNYKFLKYVSQIYQCYQIQIKQKIQFDRIMSYAMKIQINKHNQKDIQDQTNQQSEKLEILCNFVAENIRNYILQKSKRQQFNFRPVLNFITFNQFINSCQNIKNQSGYKIMLAVYNTLLEFTRFQQDMTINLICQLFKNIGITQKYGSLFYMNVLNLLIKCYQIKQRGRNNNFVQTISQLEKKLMGNQQSALQKHLQSLLNKFLTKYYNLDERQNKAADKVREKYSELIITFQINFIQNIELQQHLDHFCFSLKLLLSYYWQFISKMPKQNQFYTSICHCLIKKLNRIQEISRKLQRQIQNIWRSDSQMTSEDEEDFAQKFFIRQKKKKQIKQQFTYLLAKIIRKQNKLLPIKKELLHFYQMANSHQNICYEIHGLVSTFNLLYHHEIINIDSTIFSFLKFHTKQIRYEKSKVTNIYQSTTNKQICQFIRGVIQAIKIISSLSVNNSQDMISKNYTKFINQLGENILDILFINFTVEKDSKTLGQILRTIKSIKQLKNKKHVLTKFFAFQSLISNQKPATQSNAKQFKNFLSNILQSKQSLAGRDWQQYIKKFGKAYFDTIIKLYNKYQQINQKYLQADLALNILNIYIFLFEAEAPESIIKQYRPYFFIADYKANTNSLLKCLDYRELNLDFIYKNVMELLQIYYPKKDNLPKQIQQYINFLVNSQIMAINPNNSNYQFKKIKAFINVLHDKTSSQQSSSNFTTQICDKLLTRFIKQSLEQQKAKQIAISAFLSWFKQFKKFNQIFTTKLLYYHEQIDKIIRNSKMSLFKSCENIEETIRKYAIKQNYDNVEYLYTILQRRVMIAIKNNRKQKNVVLQLQQIIQICKNFRKRNDETLIQKYEILGKKLEYPERNNQMGRSTFHYIFDNQSQQLN